MDLTRGWGGRYILPTLKEFTMIKINRRRTKKAYLHNGIKFRSKYEAKIAEQLTNLGLDWEYEPETLRYVPPVCTYTPDFRINYPNGKTEYIEVKGYLDPLSRNKMLCVKQQYPNLNFSFHFMRDNKLGSKSKIKYTDWAIKHGFTLRQSFDEIKLEVERLNKLRAKQKAKLYTTKVPEVSNSSTCNVDNQGRNKRTRRRIKEERR